MTNFICLSLLPFSLWDLVFRFLFRSLSVFLSDSGLPHQGPQPWAWEKAVRAREAWESPSSKHFHSGCERNDMHWLLSERHEVFWLVLVSRYTCIFFFVLSLNRKWRTNCLLIFLPYLDKIWIFIGCCTVLYCSHFVKTSLWCYTHTKHQINIGERDNLSYFTAVLIVSCSNFSMRLYNTAIMSFPGSLDSSLKAIVSTKIKIPCHLPPACPSNWNKYLQQYINPTWIKTKNTNHQSQEATTPCLSLRD